MLNFFLDSKQAWMVHLEQKIFSNFKVLDACVWDNQESEQP